MNFFSSYLSDALYLYFFQKIAYFYKWTYWKFSFLLIFLYYTLLFLTINYNNLFHFRWKSKFFGIPVQGSTKYDIRNIASCLWCPVRSAQGRLFDSAQDTTMLDGNCQRVRNVMELSHVYRSFGWKACIDYPTSRLWIPLLQL